jgi:hypothetical protein
MIQKAGLAWKLRGYPYKVEAVVTESNSSIVDWCGEHLTHGTWVRISLYETVFSNQEDAMAFALTWAYNTATA